MLLPPIRKKHKPTANEALKALVKAWLPPKLWDIAKFLQAGCPKYHGRQNLDAKLEKYLDYDNGYFVELGANDGVAQSNTLYFETRRGWTGVLIEPTPNNYLLCRQNRSDDVQVFCNACVAFGYPETYVEIIYSDLMSTPVGLESDVKNAAEHAAIGKPFLKPREETYRFGALARPLNEVLAEAKAPALIDLLSLDVEGAEIEVLKGIDHNQFRFKYLCVECRDEPVMTAYLTSVGYRLVEALGHMDYLYANAR